MKTLLLTTLLSLCSFAQAQIYNSVQNGNWTNPSTWDCNCDPTIGSTVINITHGINLDTSLSGVTQIIYIDSMGGLYEDSPGTSLVSLNQIWNYGTFYVTYLSFIGVTQGHNYGKMTVGELYLNGQTAQMHNYDSLLCNVEIMIDTGFLFNELGGVLETGNLNSTLGGTSNYGALYAYRITTGNRMFDGTPVTFSNNGTVIVEDYVNWGGTYYSYDAGVMQVNDSVMNEGVFQIMDSSEVWVDGNFINNVFVDTIPTAWIEANGYMHIYGDFLNDTTDYISGTGNICIEGFSTNHGTINGNNTLGLCDISGNGMFDLNSAFINNVLWCPMPTCQPLAIEEQETPFNLKAFPNPAGESVRLMWKNPSKSPITFKIMDVQGRVLEEKQSDRYENSSVLDLQQFSSGLLIISLQNELGDNATIKIIKE